MSIFVKVHCFTPFSELCILYMCKNRCLPLVSFRQIKETWWAIFSSCLFVGFIGKANPKNVDQS